MAYEQDFLKGDSMQNMFDYLEWRGDLSFGRDEFNEVDNLILSTLAYLKLDGVVPPHAAGGSIKLSKVAEQLTKRYDNPADFINNLFLKQIPDFFMKAAQTVRYRDLELSGYVNQVDHGQSKQFSAVVFSINSKQHFIAFRGTDDTVAGWKEDFRMSFMDEVQAQLDAVMIPLQKGVFFSRISPSRKLTGIIIHLICRYFSFMVLSPDCGYYSLCFQFFSIKWAQ
jgi:hypothetical protein